MTITDITNDIVSELVGCPRPAIERALLQTAQEACRKASLYVGELNDFTTVSGTGEYSLTVPTGTLIHRIYGVYTTTDDTTTYLEPSPVLSQSKEGYPKYFWTDGLKVFIYPIPNVVKTFEVSAVLIPQSLSDLPDNIVARESDLLREGALSRLRRQLSEEWGQANLSAAHYAEYQKLLGDARKRTLQGQVGARLTTQYRRLGY